MTTKEISYFPSAVGAYCIRFDSLLPNYTNHDSDNNLLQESKYINCISFLIRSLKDCNQTTYEMFTKVATGSCNSVLLSTFKVYRCLDIFYLIIILVMDEVNIKNCLENTYVYQL